MELYVLDDQFRRSEVVGKFESAIWTERFREYGDFEIDIPTNAAHPALRTYGTFLACDKSERVMFVDRSERTSSDGDMLKVTGKSIEALLLDRPNDYTVIVAGTGSAPTIWGPARPGDIMRDMFVNACLHNQHFDQDSFPFIQSGQINLMLQAIAEPNDQITIQSDIDSLYNSLKNIADVYDLGFRLVRRDGDEGADGKLYFEVYTGFDRTTRQLVLDPLVFGSDMDNLENTNEIISIENYKNVAYVFAQNGSAIVYAPEVDSSVDGFERKVLIVNASDVSMGSGSALQDLLNQRGVEALAKANLVQAFDGEIPQDSGFTYGVDYLVGDIVEQRSDDGVFNRARITEQIISQDTGGEKCYPTLTLDTTILPGSWDSALPNVHWDDVNVTWDNYA